MASIQTKNKTRPLVSVIVPTYNRGWCLKEAIDSVLGQAYPNMELIVVDDGSTDDTEQILRAYADRGQLTAHRQANRGVSASRNFGIASARGDYMAFLDSDDIWLPGKLTRQVSFFQSNPKALLCQTEEIWIRNGRRVNPKKRHQKLSGMIFEPSLALCLVSPSAVMIHRRFFDVIGLFDEQLPACEDYDLWLRASLHFPIHLIPTPLIIKRGGHPDQLSRRPSLDKYRIMSICKLLDTEKLDAGQYQAAVAMLKKKCDVYAAGCLKRGRHAEAATYLKLASRYSELA